MPIFNRSNGRDVHVYDANDPDTVIGGLVLTRGMTNSNLYSMVEIICFIDSVFFLRDEYAMSFGKPVRFHWVPELVLQHFATPSAIEIGAYGQHWTNHDYSRWITVPATSGGSINSVQNGVLLRGDIHSLFDSYLISINPDDNYKIVCFQRDGKNIAGKHLDQQFLEDPCRPVDQLLRWHFRQAVLANMKGTGEPVFECDFPPGSDMMGEILSGPRARELMEFELFSRFAAGDKQREDTLVYGNSLGHKLLENHEALKAEIARAAAHRNQMTRDLAETKRGLGRDEPEIGRDGTGLDRVESKVYRSRSPARSSGEGDRRLS
ncbi:MAG: hypothetical protein M1840_004254 [Geoglossum simile]|nr:MAG: hypothetical protein M1840_004254 [Geoglossum simile]